MAKRKPSKHPALHFHKASGPLASVYACKYCKEFRMSVKKRVPGVGRGYGLAQGSKAMAAVWEHVKSEHADILAEMEKAEKE